MGEDLERTVDRLGTYIERLERVVYGDEYARVPGILAQLDGLRVDVQSVRTDVQSVRTDIAAAKAHGPQIWLWIVGYVAFLISGMFAASAFHAMPELQAIFAIPGPVALALAAIFAGAALVLFAAGFGWLTRVG